VKPLRNCHLYAFVDSAYLHGREPAEVARQLCDGGADLIQLRTKGGRLEDIQRVAEKLLPICERAGVGLVINDHPKLALQLGAPLCHLGQEDFFDAGFTRAEQVTGCPKQIQLGLSTHFPEQAQRALRAAPDYIAIGPVFATATKPGRAAVTLDYVRWAAANVHIPWFAIGGITLENLDQVLAAGATRICVVGAILNAPDITEACRRFKDRLPSAPLKS
jgi:thiamine-phosphate pyrophosphorylase